TQPADAAERLQFARLCGQYKGLHAAAARLYADAFAARPELAGDPGNGPRYQAACSAALAGCGKGEDAAGLDDRERARLRQQARAGLQADRALVGGQADSEAKARQAAAQTLRHWQTGPDLAGVREAEALARLPEAERPAWGKFWEEVKMLLEVVPR